MSKKRKAEDKEEHNLDNRPVFVLVKTEDDADAANHECSATSTIVGVYRTCALAKQAKRVVTRGMDTNDGETYDTGECWHTSFKIFEQAVEDEVYDSEEDCEDGDESEGEGEGEGEGESESDGYDESNGCDGWMPPDPCMCEDPVPPSSSAAPDKIVSHAGGGMEEMVRCLQCVKFMPNQGDPEWKARLARARKRLAKAAS